jgi:ubiquinol-cytochrome c reductase cytochrome b subunit
MFIAALVLIPFIDRYKKFSWRDRPMITAFGITGIAQIMVTTYWGFYISPDTTLPLVERLVIDPIFFYSTMILLVPLSFGFTYMMIKLANESERKAKLRKENEPKKVATINLSEKWINWLLIALLAFQVLLNIAAYNAALTGMKNISLFFIGIILIVFAGFFHIYRYGLAQAKNPPPPPPLQEPEEKPKLQGPQSIPESSKLPEGSGKSDDKKEISSEIQTPKIQADVGFDVNRDPNIGSTDNSKQ